MFVEAGHIDTGDFGYFLQILRLAPALFFGLLIEGHDFHRNLLTLAQGEEVDKVRQGLRIVGTDATGEDHMLQPGPLAAVQGNPGQVQHIDDIGVAHFVADGEGDHIKIPNGILTLQGPEGELVLAHGILHISPGSEDALTPHALHFVHNAVKNAHTQVGHTQLIGIGEAIRNAHVYFLQGLDHLVVFTANVACRLLHGRQDTM